VLADAGRRPVTALLCSALDADLVALQRPPEHKDVPESN
jgi:hypothetical protein